MGKKKSAPVDPRSVPVPEVTHCVFCGKRLSPQTVSENRGACGECSSPVGKMAEIWVNLRRKERHAGTRTTVSDYFESLPTWQAIQHFTCAKFSHTTFTIGTWKRLQLWLSAERGIDEGTFLRMLPEAVEKVLRDDATTAVEGTTGASAVGKPAKGIQRCQKLAYYASRYAEWKLEGKLSAQEVYDYWKEYGFAPADKDTENAAELAEYQLPDTFATFQTQLSNGRRAFNDRRNENRKGRQGRSIVGKDEL